jgi:hemerythrin
MITLTKDMQTGISLVDDWQVELIGRLNSVIPMIAYAPKDNAQKTMLLVGRHIAGYFEAEEELMESSGYPELHRHREQHQSFIREYKHLEEEFTVNGMSPGFTVHLSNSIINWIVYHIKTDDVEFGRFYLRQ